MNATRTPINSQVWMDFKSCRREECAPALRALAKYNLVTQHTLYPLVHGWDLEHLVEAAREVALEASAEEEHLLGRLLAHAALYRGLSLETVPLAGEALERLKARAAPDWGALVRCLDAWEAGGEVFDDPQRNAEAAFLLSESHERALKPERWLRIAVGGYEPLFAVFVAARISPRRTASPLERWMELVAAELGEVYAPLMRAALAHRSLDELGPLYEFCAKRGVLEVRHHVRALNEGSTTTARHALRELIALGEEALPALSEGLDARRAPARMQSAQAIGAIGLASALPILREALEGEKARSVRAALEEALEACGTSESERVGSLGVYRLDDAIDANHALEQLRAVLCEEPTALSFVRLCDCLERARQANSLEMALDYLDGTGGVGRWSSYDRVRPICWSEPRLLALGEVNDYQVWVPISFTQDPGWEAYVDSWLQRVEGGARVRRLDKDKIGLFLRWVEAGQAFCERHAISLDRLGVFLDGGAKRRTRGRPVSTTLELYQGFGLRLHRPSAYSGADDSGQVRWVRVKVEPDDVLKVMYEVPKGSSWLELNQLFGSPEEALEG